MATTGHELELVNVSGLKAALQEFKNKHVNNKSSQKNFEQLAEALGLNTSCGVVDLGLPSGNLWAQCNIGSTTPEGSGKYFSWGNVEGHEAGEYNFTSENYNASDGVELTGNIPVGSEYDMANANLRGLWRLPTTADFQELNDNCVSVWTTINDVAGRLFTSKNNGATIFFPACGFCNSVASPGSVGVYGCYWSSELNAPTYANFLTLSSYSVTPQNNTLRYFGQSVRAVMSGTIIDEFKKKYNKPQSGIPSTDLASAVQALLTAAGTALQPSDLNTLNGKVAALEAYFSSEADTDTIINKWNEIVAFLSGISETDTLQSFLNSISTQISGKADKTNTYNKTETDNAISNALSALGLTVSDGKLCQVYNQ